MDKEKLIKVISKTGFIFGLLVWFYVIALQIAHPSSVTWTFTRWLRVRNDYVAEFSFVVSLISFIAWQYVK